METAEQVEDGGAEAGRGGPPSSLSLPSSSAPSLPPSPLRLLSSLLLLPLLLLPHSPLLGRRDRAATAATAASAAPRSAPPSAVARFLPREQGEEGEGGEEVEAVAAAAVVASAARSSFSASPLWDGGSVGGLKGRKRVFRVERKKLGGEPRPLDFCLRRRVPIFFLLVDRVGTRRESQNRSSFCPALERLAARLSPSSPPCPVERVEFSTLRRRRRGFEVGKVEVSTLPIGIGLIERRRRR